jgi:hypothetical protein
LSKVVVQQSRNFANPAPGASYEPGLSRITLPSQRSTTFQTQNTQPSPQRMITDERPPCPMRGVLQDKLWWILQKREQAIQSLEFGQKFETPSRYFLTNARMCSKWSKRKTPSEAQHNRVPVKCLARRATSATIVQAYTAHHIRSRPGITHKCNCLEFRVNRE